MSTGTTDPAVPALRAVLFDMDGTLVQTEHYWGQALHALARRLGGALSEAAREATIGVSMATSMAILAEDLGIERTEEQHRADGIWVEDHTAELMTGGIEWQPGAAELLTEARAAGLATALVTTTPRRMATIVLTSMARDLGVDPFDVTVCGDEVSARKPDPAPYLQAQDALGVGPRECVVIEDSAVGVASGLASGAAVLGVPTVQGLAPEPGLTLRDSLAGIGVAELVAVLENRTPAASRR